MSKAHCVCQDIVSNCLDHQLESQRIMGVKVIMVELELTFPQILSSCGKKQAGITSRLEHEEGVEDC